MNRFKWRTMTLHIGKGLSYVSDNTGQIQYIVETYTLTGKSSRMVDMRILHD